MKGQPTSRLNVLLIAEESAGIQTLKLLAQSGHQVVGVLASPSRQSIGEATVWKAASRIGYKTWNAETVRDPDFANTVSALEVDLILNVHSLFIIRQNILEASKIGSFNLHPGPLPRYAGLNPVSWAIFRGETEHGVTLHRMEGEIDAGPIAYQSVFPIEETDTPLTVSLKCVKSGIPLVQQLLDAASVDPNAIPLTDQDLTKREYFGRGVPNKGFIRWDRPARDVVNFVRSCDYAPFPSPWGHPKTRQENLEFEIVKAYRTGKPCSEPPGTVSHGGRLEILVACADEWIRIQKVNAEGKMKAASEVVRSGSRLDGVVQTESTVRERGS